MSRSYREHLDRMSEEQYAEEMQDSEEAFLCQSGYLEMCGEQTLKRLMAGFDALRHDGNRTFTQQREQL